MAPITEPVLPVAATLLAALDGILEASDAPVCQTGFGFGSPPPVDACCECPDPAVTRSGQAWVRVGALWYTKAFPALLTTVTNCEPSLAATFSLGIYRCAPTLDDEGNPPDPTELGLALDRQLQDAALLLQAVQVTFSDAPPGIDRPYLVSQWEPQEPRGGCMGGSVTVSVQLTDGYCP